MRYTAAVITVSDKGYEGKRADTSGPAICEMLKNEGYDVVYTSIVPDDMEMIKSELIKASDELNISLVITTGGTGFSPRDITPEATLAVIERETPGIPEAMRIESLKITPRGCLSRSAAGIRKGTLIVNLPGSEKAARENLSAVSGSLEHGLQMLSSQGSADCAAHGEARPSIDSWLREARKAPDAGKIGMYLTHNGVVRATARAAVREGKKAPEVTGMEFSFDAEKLKSASEEALAMEGIYYVRTWLNHGTLKAGDDLMLVLIGGDIRTHVVSALDFLVGKIKKECVCEKEIY